MDGDKFGLNRTLRVRGIALPIFSLLNQLEHTVFIEKLEVIRVTPPGVTLETLNLGIEIT